MKSPKVTVIVPVYNSETTIGRCLKSILTQDYGNIDIVIVDDGSTDATHRICTKYASNNSDINYYRKKNGGVSSARNYGIENAKGDYIAFVDSDDFVAPSYISSLLNNTSNSTQACCPIHETHKPRNENKTILENNKYDSIFYNCWAFPTNRLYSKNILDENSIRFRDDIYMCEDLAFNIEYIDKIKKIVILNECLYKYNRREQSESRRMDNEKWFSIFAAIKNLIKKYEDFSIFGKKKMMYFTESIIAEAEYRRRLNGHAMSKDEKEVRDWLTKIHHKMFFADRVKLTIMNLFPKHIFEKGIGRKK